MKDNDKEHKGILWYIQRQLRLDRMMNRLKRRNELRLTRAYSRAEDMGYDSLSDRAAVRRLMEKEKQKIEEERLEEERLKKEEEARRESEEKARLERERTAWRQNAEDGTPYGLDPELYDSEEEYMEDLTREKYAWRNWCEPGWEYDLNPEDFETEEEYNEALNEEKYGWRDEITDDWKCDVCPEDYETKEEYEEALYEEKYGWRNEVRKVYGVDPEKYETKEEYEEALYREEYGWRDCCRSNEYGINPEDYETEDEYDEAVDEAEEYVWRNEVEDGTEYGIVPEDYDTREEYEEALNEEKYRWRDFCQKNTCGVNLKDYETEEEYDEAVEDARYAWREEIENSWKHIVDPQNYETREEYEEALNEEKYGWRDFCQKNNCGVNPKDYETEDEYDEAVEEARYAWREEIENSWEYTADPQDYETREEYEAALYSEKYGWRDWCKKNRYGIKPEDYETENEYDEAVEKALYAWREEVEDGSKYGVFPEDYQTKISYCSALNRKKKAHQRELEKRAEDERKKNERINAIWRDANRREGSKWGINPDYYETKNAFDEAISEAKLEWRLVCEDGKAYGVNPQRHKTLSGYEEKLREKRETVQRTWPSGDLYRLDPFDYNTLEAYTAAIEAKKESDEGKPDTQLPDDGSFDQIYLASIDPKILAYRWNAEGKKKRMEYIRSTVMLEEVWYREYIEKKSTEYITRMRLQRFVHTMRNPKRRRICKDFLHSFLKVKGLLKKDPEIFEKMDREHEGIIRTFRLRYSGAVLLEKINLRNGYMWDELWEQISYDYKLRLERALSCYQFLKEYAVTEAEENCLNDLVNRKLKAYKLDIEDVLVYQDEQAKARDMAT